MQIVLTSNMLQLKTLNLWKCLINYIHVHTGARCVRKKTQTTLYIILFFLFFFFFPDAPCPCACTCTANIAICSIKYEISMKIVCLCYLFLLMCISSYCYGLHIPCNGIIQGSSHNIILVTRKCVFRFVKKWNKRTTQ